MPEPTAVVEPKTEVKPTESLIVEAPKVETKVEPAKVVEPTKPAEPVKPVAPEKYDLKIPEKSLLSAKDIETISAQAKEKGLSNDQAQMLVEAKHAGAVEYAQRELERIKTEAPKWLEQLKADKEIGGEKFNESVENAKRVINKYADQQFKDFLNETGLGNHPNVVKIFAKVGKAFGEDHWKEGAPITPKKDVSAASVLYDKTPK